MTRDPAFAATPVVRVGDPGDVAAALDSVLGFRPTESLVVVCLIGPRHRFGLTLRYDLPAASDEEGLALEAAARVHHAGAAAAIAAVFTEAPTMSQRLPNDELVGTFEAALDVPLVEALLVRDRRWWSYLCAGTGCCPPEGRRVRDDSPTVTAIAAASAWSGRGVLADRDALVASVAFAGDAPSRMSEVADALERAAQLTDEERRARAIRLADRLHRRLADPRREVADHEAAELAALCHDLVARDSVLVKAIGRQRRRRQVVVLREVLRRVPPPFDVPVASMLAWTAYADGDGAVANVALERALASSPDYPLALLILDALDRQIPPSGLITTMREAARDLRGRSTAG